MWPVFIGALVLGVVSVAVFWKADDIKSMAGLAMAFWLVAGALLSLYNRVSLRATLWEGLRSQSPSIYGMTLAHIGAAVFLVGAVLSNQYSVEKIVRLAPGESAELGGFSFKFNGVSEVSGPNYRAKEGSFTASKNGQPVAEMKPQKRIYKVQRNTMTEAAIDAGLLRDLYVALGESMDKGAWSVRLYVKPFIRWIWLGGLFMMAGGLCSVADRRYRLATASLREPLGAAGLAGRKA
jgi:cytochrome c-type biogenesis protein CcmF